MRYLWMISGAMILLGLVLALAAMLSIASPIALVAGVLLIWSGIIKILVLRIWRSTLPSKGSAPASVRIAASATAEHR